MARDGAAVKRRERVRWRALYPEKRAAHRALLKAVRRGTLAKPDRCSRCGTPGPVEGHHHLGYAAEHRFHVLWLCHRCHQDEHKNPHAPAPSPPPGTSAPAPSNQPPQPRPGAGEFFLTSRGAGTPPPSAAARSADASLQTSAGRVLSLPELLDGERELQDAILRGRAP